jgi:hypothetical protein
MKFMFLHHSTTPHLLPVQKAVVTIINIIKDKKGKAIPVTGRGGP